MDYLLSSSPICQDLETYYLSRIDVCMNFYLGPIEEFVNVTRKCLSPKGFKKLLQKNMKIPKDGVYLMGRDKNIQIYNKYRQMQNEGYEHRESELEAARNLLRYEVQLFRPQILKYIDKGLLPKNLTDGVERTFIALGCLAPYILLKTSIKCFGLSPYYTGRDIHSKIFDSRYNLKTKKQMSFFQDLVAKYNDADRAAENFTRQNNSMTIKKLIKKFDALGVNIIAVSGNKDDNLQPILPSIPELVNKAISDNYNYWDELIQLNVHYNPTIHIPPYFHEK